MVRSTMTDCFCIAALFICSVMVVAFIALGYNGLLGLFFGFAFIIVAYILINFVVKKQNKKEKEKYSISDSENG
ncbi:MAG: hypothetical protein ACFFAO_03820 [Candidatus Hermodarchaeota archaeon]